MTFDAFVREIEQRYGLSTSDAQGLLSSLLGIVFDPRRGGMAGLSARFQRRGLGALFGSWLGRSGRAQSIEPHQLERVLGAEILAKVAARLGTDRNVAAAASCGLLPRLIGAFTADGCLPADIPDPIRRYLVGLPGFVELMSRDDGESGSAARSARTVSRRSMRGRSGSSNDMGGRAGHTREKGLP